MTNKRRGRRSRKIIMWKKRIRRKAWRRRKRGSRKNGKSTKKKEKNRY